jgi:hypothetical protein
MKLFENSLDIRLFFMQSLSEVLFFRKRFLKNFKKYVDQKIIFSLAFIDFTPFKFNHFYLLLINSIRDLKN